MAGEKIQGSVSAYHKFVIDGLVGIDGHGESQVTARIVGDWIGEHSEYLEKLGLSVDDWRKTLKSGHPSSSSANVVSLEDKQGAKATGNEGKGQSS